MGRVEGSSCRSGSLVLYFFNIGRDVVDRYVDLSNDADEMVFNVGVFECGNSIGNGFDVVNSDALVSTSYVGMGDSDEEDGEDVGKGVDVFVDVAREDSEVG